jgi:hypothetical protein
MDNAQDVHAIRGGKRDWSALLSDKGLTTIIAVGTVVLVLLATATLIVILLLPFAGPFCAQNWTVVRVILLLTGIRPSRSVFGDL